MTKSHRIRIKPVSLLLGWAIAGMAMPLSSVRALAQLPSDNGNIESETVALDPSKIQFYCKEVQDPTSPGQKIIATVVWVPERRANVRLVGWKSEYFSKTGFDPVKRCDVVSPKFQKAYEEGRLLLATGYVAGYPVVCGVATSSESCNSENQLFSLKPHDYPDEILARLLDIVEGKSSDLLLQNSGGKFLVLLEKWLKKGPVTDRDAPRGTKTAGASVFEERDELQVPM